MLHLNEIPHPHLDSAHLSSPTYESSLSGSRLLELLPKRGDIQPLNDILEVLANDDAYAVVAELVRARYIIVEFEAEARPFPFRDIMVRRL